ncbi:hypothetical protein [Bradyrhizobium sp. RDM4]|uniref:hypothetical protein n=1 Tax=Bradyrhizobium sp. RDM4 TaxID=3378765 RepID=UPI0038FC7C5E
MTFEDHEVGSLRQSTSKILLALRLPPSRAARFHRLPVRIDQEQSWCDYWRGGRRHREYCYL